MTEHPDTTTFDPATSPLVEHLGAHTRAHPDRVATIDGETMHTWRQLSDAVDAKAGELNDLGIGIGDIVAVRSHPSSEWWQWFLAIISIGAIHQGLNPKYRTRDLTVVLDDTRPAHIIDLTADADPLPPLTDEGGDVRTGTSNVAANDIAAVIHTSGSSGTPKGALLTHHGLDHCSRIASELFTDNEPLTLICNFPVNHVACLGDICCSAYVGGGTIVFQREFSPVDVLELIERHRINLWGAIPVMLQLSVNAPEFETADLTSVKRVVWAGNPAPRPLVERLRARFPQLTTAYGLTETTGNVTFTDDDDTDETLAATIGRPHPAYEIDLVDDTGQSVPDGNTGEILVRGSFIMAGYLNRPDATAETVDADGWLHTGDLATRRRDGTLELVGRRSDMFKSGGYNVYPREIEALLEDHSAVDAAAVVGVPDDLYTEVGAAFVTLTPGTEHTVSADDLRASLGPLLANYKIPKTLTIVDELPLLPVGKIDKVTLRQRAQQGTAP